MRGLQWLWVSVIGLLLDQASKLWVQAEFVEYERLQVLPFFNLTLVYNKGAAFSLLADAGGWQRWFFTALALVIAVILVRWMRQVRPGQWPLGVGLALVLSGAMGNLIDRLWQGKVTDFLDFYWNDWHWPAFNVADSAITVGVVLLLWDVLRQSDRTDEA